MHCNIWERASEVGLTVVRLGNPSVMKAASAWNDLKVLVNPPMASRV